MLHRYGQLTSSLVGDGIVIITDVMLRNNSVLGECIDGVVRVVFPNE